MKAMLDETLSIKGDDGTFVHKNAFIAWFHAKALPRQSASASMASSRSSARSHCLPCAHAAIATE